MIGNSNDEIKIPHKLLSTDTQVSKICKAFANGLSANKNFSKTQLSKRKNSLGFLTDIYSVTSTLDNIFNSPFKVMNSYLNEVSNINDKKCTRT